MSWEILLAILAGFVLSAILCPLLIPVLHRLKFGQQVRDDGPQAHLKKQGTPTMGGIAFLSAILVVGCVFALHHPKIWPILAVTMAYGLVGFLDDFMKVVKKRSLGLKAWQKMILQIIIMGGFCFYMMRYSEIGTVIRLPFTDVTWDLKWFYPVFLLLVMVGTDNGVNFTDGIDGLCTTVTIVVSLFLTAAAVKTGTDIAPVPAAVAGALMAFLMFNVYPAKVFMGDTGSLALGGFVASSFIMLGQPLLILIVGFIYLVEVLSVMLQVGYFKATHGKRIFKMAPIHHHFELCGWSEAKVVAVFSIVTALLCFVAYLGL